MLRTGVGVAWQWQGQAGGGLDEKAVQGIQAFLSQDSPRVRALGGARFDSQGRPSQEWQDFGSYLFMLPRCDPSSFSGVVLDRRLSICFVMAYKSTTLVLKRYLKFGSRYRLDFDKRDENKQRQPSCLETVSR